MDREIDLREYELLPLAREEAYARAAVLLGLRSDPSAPGFADAVGDWIDSRCEWCRNDMEYRYMGYDCGDCYVGGDVKKGIVCGGYLVVHAACPNYRSVRIYRKKR